MGSGISKFKASESKRRQLLQMRKRSLSDGNLPKGIVQKLNPTQDKKVRETTPLSIPARDLNKPVLQGYIDRLVPDEGWENVWCVLKDSSLYIYNSPIDEESIDSVQLPGWVLVAGHVDKDTREYMFELQHEEYFTECFSAESADDFKKWLAELQRATQKLTIEGLNLEQPGTDEIDDPDKAVQASCEQNDREWQEELLRVKKQQLLEELEREKQLALSALEENQCNGMKSSSSTPSLNRDVMTSSDPSSLSTETDIRALTHLQQRRLSMELKLTALKKNLQERRKSRKKMSMKLGSRGQQRDDSVGLKDDVFIQKQVEELKTGLDQVGQEIKETQKRTLSIRRPTLPDKNMALLGLPLTASLPTLKGSKDSGLENCDCSPKASPRRSNSTINRRGMAMNHSDSSLLNNDRKYSTRDRKQSQKLYNSMDTLDGKTSSSRTRLDTLRERLKSTKSRSFDSQLPPKDGESNAGVKAESLAHIEDFERLLVEKLKL